MGKYFSLAYLNNYLRVSWGLKQINNPLNVGKRGEWKQRGGWRRRGGGGGVRFRTKSILEGIIDLIDRVAIGYEVSGKVRHIAIKDVGRWDLKGLSGQIFKYHRFFHWVVVWICMKVLVCMSHFPLNFVCKTSIGLTRDENIKKNKIVFCSNFHGKSDFRGNVVKMVKEGV